MGYILKVELLGFMIYWLWVVRKWEFEEYSQFVLCWDDTYSFCVIQGMAELVAHCHQREQFWICATETKIEMFPFSEWIILNNSTQQGNYLSFWECILQLTHFMCTYKNVAFIEKQMLYGQGTYYGHACFFNIIWCRTLGIQPITAWRQ